jgi:hypothetical protein
MFDGILNAITDFFRDVLFSIAQCFMFLLDIVWQCVLKIVTLDFYPHIGNWFVAVSLFLGLFMLLRLAKIFVKTMFWEDYRLKLSVSDLLVKMILVSFAISFAPLAYQGINSMTINFIEKIEYFIPNTTKDSNPSTIILESGRINTSDINADLGPEINMENFDINAKENDEYIYFNTYTSLFLLIVESVVCSFIFILIAIQIAQRLFIMIYKYLLAPYAISALIENEDRTFATWIKMIAGDFIMNFAQIYLTYLTLYLLNNSTIQKALGSDALGIMCKIMLFIGGLVAIMNIPSSIAQLIGGHGAGALESLQQAKTITSISSAATLGMVGATIGTGLGAVGGAIGVGSQEYARYHESSSSGGMRTAMHSIGGAVAGAGVGAMKTAQQHFGGGQVGGGLSAGAGILASGIGAARSSLQGQNDLQAQNGDNSQSTGSTSDNNGKNFKSSFSFMNNASGLGSLGSKSETLSQAFDDSPTEKQLYAAKKLGIENPENYSKGELSMMMQEAGADESYWNSSKQANSFMSQKGIDDSLKSQYQSTATQSVQDASGMYSQRKKKRLGK